MDHFRYEGDKLYCENVSVEAIADAAGTPCYIYSVNTIREHYKKFYKAFSEIDPLICFSIKNCNNIHLIKELVELGSGIDTVSGGEIFLALKAGVDPAKIVFAGIGKTDEEILFALDNGIGVFNVESEAEFENISRLAHLRNKPVKVALRVTPDVIDEKTHDKTKTGYKGSKFGVDIDRALRFFESYGKDDLVKLSGIHIHIGSPIYSPRPYELAITKTLGLIDQLEELGHKIDIFDIGGGYSADYEKGKSCTYDDFAAGIAPLLAPYVKKGMKVVMEPGRTITGNAGILVTKTIYLKEGGPKKFAIVDTGMHHLMRPALYEAEHFIWPVNNKNTPNEMRVIAKQDGNLLKYDVVGPICESTDYLAKDRNLPVIEQGDYLAIFTAGAYGMVMANNYNATCRPPEVMVDDTKAIQIRKRETYDDLLSHIDKKDILG